MKIFLFLPLIYISCNKNVSTNHIISSYVINIYIEEPYCGGAKPQNTIQIQPKNKTPIQNKAFYIGAIIDNKLSKESLSKYITDVNGSFTAKISYKKYGLYDKDKMLSFEEFYSQKRSNKDFFLNDTEECYRKWWSTPDAIITLDDNQNIEVVLSNKCYTGTNPCLQYTGPMNR